LRRRERIGERPGVEGTFWKRTIDLEMLQVVSFFASASTRIQRTVRQGVDVCVESCEKADENSTRPAQTRCKRRHWNILHFLAPRLAEVSLSTFYISKFRMCKTVIFRLLPFLILAPNLDSNTNRRPQIK
jgi:hypothetical protein